MPRKSVKTKKNASKVEDSDTPSAAELSEMAALLTLFDSPTETLNENLPYFIKLLDPSEIPPDGLPKPALSQIHAIPALLGVARWARLNIDTVAARLKDSWPDIWSWITCLLKLEFKDLKLLAHQACCSLVLYLGVDRNMCELMASTPGTIATIVRLWVAELDPEYLLDARIPFFESVSASHAVVLFMNLGEVRSFDEITAVLREDGVDIARVVLDTIKRRIEDSSRLNISSLYADLAILHIVCEFEALHAHLLCGPAMQIVNGAMVRLLCYEGPDRQRAATCLKYCVRYYVHGLLSSYGRSWAFRMFDGPIIRAIVQASIWSAVHDQDLSEALDTFTPYLLFRSVLRRAEKALDIIHELDLEKDMGEDTLVYHSFKRYKSLAGERILIAEGRTLGTTMCDNQPCSKVDRGKVFMRCSGCLKVHYCSKECQRQAWKVGNHRDLCKLVKVPPDADIEGPEFKILPEDHKFLRKVILSDTRTHHLRIAQLKIELFLSNPALLDKSYLVAVVLDYTKPTLVVGLEPDVVGTSFAKWGNVDGHKALVTMVDRLQGGASGLVVRVVLPYGKEPLPREILLRDFDQPGSSQGG